MGTTEAVVAIIVALLSGGTLRSLFLYVRERRDRNAPIAVEQEQVHVTTATLELMSKAFDEEREAWANRDQIRRERIAELELELRATRDRLAEAQAALFEVTNQVQSLTERLTSLAEEERGDDLEPRTTT